MRRGDTLFKDVGVFVRRFDGGLRVGHANHVAQFSEEELVISPLRRARGLPAVDEGLDQKT